ncbi:MAG: CinA family protein [Candidatus Latescibacteria bacterium]|jgi:nicotinamide-nucleotide amidase|nr:CinA family protein [Candidatus Latescibacterota bacterium]
MPERLEITLGKGLRERGWTIAVAETTTGGLISARIVSVPGSSAYYERGVIAYSKVSKSEMLGIDLTVIDEYGAVSAETAAVMAKGVQKVSGATLGLAETGIAGPILGRSPKPVGTTYIALAGPDHTVCEDFQFDGDRDAIREAIADAALQMVVNRCG